MPYIMIVAMLIAGFTFILFPSQWKSFYANFSTLAIMRDFWQRQSDMTFRMIGILLVFIAICLFLTLKTGGH